MSAGRRRRMPEIFSEVRAPRSPGRAILCGAGPVGPEASIRNVLPTGPTPISRAPWRLREGASVPPRNLRGGTATPPFPVNNIGVS